MFSASQYELSACQHDRETAHRRRVFVELSQILIQDINIFKMWHNLANQRPQILAEMGDFSVAPSC